MSSPDSSPSPNTQFELAKERNRIAADRSLLAWIRTSLTLIGIGFGIDQTVSLLYQSIGDAINPSRFAHILGLVLIGLGVYALVIAAIDYRGELHRLNQSDYAFTPRYPLGETVAIALFVIALVIVALITFRLVT
ncbi:MAG: YidH family protein [Leptolyngbyaceae cyanobacterium]